MIAERRCRGSPFQHSSRHTYFDTSSSNHCPSAAPLLSSESAQCQTVAAVVPAVVVLSVVGWALGHSSTPFTRLQRCVGQQSAYHNQATTCNQSTTTPSTHHSSRLLSALCVRPQLSRLSATSTTSLCSVSKLPPAQQSQRLLLDRQPLFDLVLPCWSVLLCEMRR